MKGDRISEQQLLDTIIELAAIKRWLIHHDRPARTKAGEWRTAVQGHSGFPDLVLVHSVAGVLYLELKSATGKLTPDQVKWLNALRDGSQRVAVVRPKQIKPLLALLTKTKLDDPDELLQDFADRNWQRFEYELDNDRAVFGPW